LINSGAPSIRDAKFAQYKKGKFSAEGSETKHKEERDKGTHGPTIIEPEFTIETLKLEKG
jgi:hypothetical protein